MRIVTRHATNARVGAVVAFTVGDPVRLESNAGNTQLRAGRDFVPSPVTPAAEYVRLLGRAIG